MGTKVLPVGGDGDDGAVSVRLANNKKALELVVLPTEAVIGAGTADHPGRLTLHNSKGKPTTNLTSVDARLTLGGHSTGGVVSVCHTDGAAGAELLALPAESVIGAGTKNRPGRLTMYNGKDEPTVNLTTADARIALGGGGIGGSVSVLDPKGSPAAELLALPKEAVIGAGTAGRAGRLTLYNNKGEPTVNLTSKDAKLTVGGGGINGSVSVTDHDGMPLLELLGLANECVLGLGQSNRPGRISVFNASGGEAVRVDGATGDILIANADCAEEFDLAEDAEVEPGMVVVLTDNGGITASTTAYDTRVAGVVSGAGAYRPGLVLDRRTTGMKRLAVALLGKVYCRVDASIHPVRIGDLLTSSDRVGHAMRATDPQRAFGAVIGKALAPLAAGSGVIPILIALQ